MKAILLAAGRGTRISRLIEAVPKCTLPVNGKPLIRHTVEALCKKQIQPIVCVGYQHQKIKEALEGLDVCFYYNPFFDVTNSISSLWFARQELDDDMLLLNADVFFPEEILDLILADQEEVVLAIDKSRIEIGDYFFQTLDGCIKKYGKDLPLSERSCEYVGIAKVTKPFLPSFRERMNQLIGTQQHHLWWENILYSFADEKPVHTIDVNGTFWAEIDYFDDYERILRYSKREDMTTA